MPCVVDLASMRDAVKRLGGDPDRINPSVPVDLVIDHSVQVDHAGDAGSLKYNLDLEFERNKERFVFLKWGANAFRGLTIVPPGAGIVHQVNLEFLARTVFDTNGELYPDSVVGTDSHTPMINGLGMYATRQRAPASILTRARSLTRIRLAAALVGVSVVSRLRPSSAASRSRCCCPRSSATSSRASCRRRPRPPTWCSPSPRTSALTGSWPAAAALVPPAAAAALVAPSAAGGALS